MKLLIVLLISSLTGGFIAWNAVEQNQDGVGTAVRTFIADQLATGYNNGEFLKTDGSGVLSWDTPAGGGGGSGVGWAVSSGTTTLYSNLNIPVIITDSDQQATGSDSVLDVWGDVTAGYFTASSTATSTFPQVDVTDLQIASALFLSGDRITDFAGTGLSVSAGTLNAEVQTSDLHDAVTVSGTPNYITLSGQDIVRAKLDLPDDINTFTEAQLETAVSDDNPLFDGDIGGSVQAFDAVLDDLAALSVVADNEFIVGTGAGTYAHESGATARTSLGLGSLATLSTINNSNWSGTDLSVANGGSGASTFTDGGILLGSGTGAFTAMAVLANGAIVVGDGTTDPVALTAFTSSTGDLIHEAGGLEADVSGYTNGLYGMISGATADIDTISEFDTALGLTGTADSSTFLRGDGEWATPAGGGGGGTLSTTTEKVLAGAAATVSYVTDEFMLGGSSSTTAEFLFDYASSTLEIRGTGSTTILSTGAEEAVVIGEGDQNTDDGWDVGEAIEFYFGTAGDVIMRAFGSVAEFVVDLNLTLTTGKNFTIGSTQWNSGDNIDGEAIANDTIDDDSIDFADVTLNDLTFDVGSVDKTEFGYLNGVTSDIQTQLDARGAIAGQVWTGVHDFGGATSFELPNDGTVDANGEATIDNTSGQLRYYGNSGERVLSFYDEKSVYLASTTKDKAGNTYITGTTTHELANYYRAVELDRFYCKTDTGTSTARFGDGTNWTATVTCTTSGAEGSSLSNNTFTSREDVQLQMGTASGDPNKVTVTATFINTAD